MAKLKKGQELVCEPCGREIVVSSCGVARTTIWCCSKPMKIKTRRTKKTVKKAPKVTKKARRKKK